MCIRDRLEDEEVQDILERDHHVVLDYAKAGSLDMVTADHTGRDFLFPSSQNALEYYQQAVSYTHLCPARRAR